MVVYLFTWCQPWTLGSEDTCVNKVDSGPHRTCILEEEFRKTSNRQTSVCQEMILKL